MKLHPILTLTISLSLLLGACLRGPATPVPATATPAVPPSTTVPTNTATPIPYTTPAWFRDAVLYEIFVRSFYDSDNDGIGDLKGVEEKLDYIQSLGANVIWLMPIYPSPSDHGYDVTDYFAVNPDYGTIDDLKSLLAAAHAKNMRVILDFVPSHLSDENPIFQSALGNPNDPRSDWFVWTNDAHTLYAGFADSADMPRFNHYNPEVVDYLDQAALFWLDLGVDGFRIDNATFPPREFFVAFRQRVKAAYPEALLLGETWVHSPSDLASFFPDQFDALFDFPVYELMLGEQAANGDGLLNGKKPTALLDLLLKDEARLYPPESMPVRFLANHDTNRAYTKLNGDPARLRLAAAFLAAQPGPIMIYYGEELGMPGQKSGPPDWDNTRREPMDWYAAESGPGMTTWFRPEGRYNKANDGISVEEQQVDANSLLNYYKMLIGLRHSRPALAIGGSSVPQIKASAAGAWSIVRRDPDGTPKMLLLFNFSAAGVEVTVPEFPFGATGLADALTGKTYPGAQNGQPYTITIPPLTSLWLEPVP
jgi:glycosidase